MKNLNRDIYLTVISFLLGVMFVVRCGGTAQSIADSIANALEVSFDNSDTALVATNTQDAIDELHHYLPFVYDANGEKVGVYFDDQEGIIQMWDFKRRLPLNVVASTGELLVYGDTTLYFGSSDCTGTTYLNSYDDDGDTDHPVYVNGQLYWYQQPSGLKRYEEMFSRIKDGEVCETIDHSSSKVVTETDSDINLDEDSSYIAARAIEEFQFSGPLSLY